MYFFKNRYFRIVFFIILGIIAIQYFHQNKLDGQALKLEVFESQNGWGYSIFYKNELLIHQPFMPAVAGNKGFYTKNEALKIGQLVCKKLKKGENWAIKKSELDSLNILY
jgi:hypothetical protein